MFQVRVFSSVRLLPAIIMVALFAPATSYSQITSQLDFAVYATGSGCGAITISGNAYIDSFDSSKGTYTQTKQLNNGIIGVTGNITLSSGATINGPVFALNTATGACANGAPGITLSGQAKVTGGYFQLGAAPSFPNPAPVTPGSQNYSFTANASLAPGSYGNIAVSGGKTLTLSPGTYNINSIALSGGSIVTMSAAGKVIINVAGKNVSQPINFASGSIVNPTGVPLNFQLVYGGASPLTVSGGASSYALLYAPNAPATLSGGGAWFGAMAVKTLSDSGGSPIHYDRSLAVPPTITPVITPAPTAAGWNNSNVTVSFVCADPILGIASCSAPVAVTNEGANQTVAGAAVNRAGFSASATATVNIDKHAPTITAAASPPPNAAGWNNTNVTVTFTCSDALSGVASCPPPVVVSTEGASQMITGTASDKAGNTATASVPVSLDKTRPSITASISPPPDAGGYNSGPATVSFSCSDSLSGLASCPSPIPVTATGSNPESGTATDNAGNTATASITVNISTSYFKIRSWQTNPAGSPLLTGKCLDYGVSPINNGASVFLNDCSAAHPIRVQEFPVIDLQKNPRPHAVILAAGNLVIGIHNPPVNTFGGPPPASTSRAGRQRPGRRSVSTLDGPPPASTAPEYPLELQTFNPNLATTSNQIFELDGDSIILEDSRPCVDTLASGPLCPSVPQLVIQVQNSLGANGSPLVVTARNLSYNEFWDFVAIDGSGKFPTGGFNSQLNGAPITTNWQLWNALCTPQVVPSIGNPVTTDGAPLIDYTTTPATATACTPSVGWGDVVVIADSDPNECTGNNIPAGVGPCIDLSAYPPITLPAGVTIRGYRRGTNFGPQLFDQFPVSPPKPFPQPNPFNHCEGCVFEIQGDYVRFTGLRLRGQSRSTDSPQPGAGEGIYINSMPAYSMQASGSLTSSLTSLIATLDHNDMSDWEVQPIDAGNAFDSTSASPTQDCTGVMNDPATLANLTITRNFLHHNEADNDGYGVLAGRAFIEGNTFLMNRHDIAGDAEAHSEYRAWYNLKLSSVPQYGSILITPFNQDFDMHGAGLGGSRGYGGVGGYSVDIAANTFLGNNNGTFGGGDNYNFELRGYPCYADYFRDNVTVRQQDSNGNGVIHFHNVTDGTTTFVLGPDGPTSPVDVAPSPTALGYPGTPPPGPVFDYSNQFGNSTPPFTDPTAQLGVGDFDGDGDADLFLATGVAWYYSPAGAMEWRFLSAKTDTIGQLLFGDFDGDGRTDVAAIHGGQLVVSWGGISDWKVLNSYQIPANVGIADMFAGRFLQHPPGDTSYDIFAADGPPPQGTGTWYLSYAGSGMFKPAANSSFRVSDLRFGDFNGDGLMDVFSVQSNGWNVSYATGLGLAGWTGWPPGGSPSTLTNTVNGLVAGDFLGGGYAVIGTDCFFAGFGFTSGSWCVAEGNGTGWTPTFLGQDFSNGLIFAGIGRFKGQSQVDLLLWDGNNLWISPGGMQAAYSWSAQEMR